MAKKYEHFERLWKEYFRDPLQWRDNRSSKLGSAYPDFKHKFSNDALWIDGRYNPSWVDEELRSRGLALSNQAQDGEEALPLPVGNDEGNDFVALLRTCSKNKDLSTGIRTHDEILKRGLLHKCADALITMYAKCGQLAKAKDLLDMHNSRDAFSWTALISGYAHQGQSQDALNCFEQMQEECLSLDWVTFTCALKACGSIRAADKGEEIHAEAARLGILGKNVVLSTALVDMYAKCGALAKAHEVLEELPDRNVVSWTAIIAGYAQEGQGEQALQCFDKMQQEGISPNAVTYASVLKACGSLGAHERGQEIHNEIVQRKLLRRDVVLATALVDMYAKCDNLAEAQRVLEKHARWDVVAWNALIVGYTQQRQAEEALNCFERMQCEGLSPNAVTYSSILKACGSIGAVYKGEEIHDEIASQGLLANNIVLGNAVIDMYAKCGALAKAQQVIENLPSRDVVSWNSLMAGYALQGQCEQALDCFKRMQGEGLSPNGVTFSCMLNACSHLGLVGDGEMYFTIMSTKYGVKPDREHYTCMVDLFGRAGHLDKAVEVIKQMPSSDDLAVWFALLGACRKWRDVGVGRWAFECAVQVDKSDPAAYVLMANIYAAAGMQEEAEVIEAMRIDNKACKIPGYSWWVDMSGKVHAFSVGDTQHAQCKDIYAKLEVMVHNLSQEGYSPSLHWVSPNISNDAKVDLICGHSEKLALACALINTPHGETIRIVKNLRVCGDCHSATALLSKIEKRRIVIRDANRGHDFEDGKCSCGDYF